MQIVIYPVLLCNRQHLIQPLVHRLLLCFEHLYLYLLLLHFPSHPSYLTRFLCNLPPQLPNHLNHLLHPLPFFPLIGSPFIQQPLQIAHALPQLTQFPILLLIACLGFLIFGGEGLHGGELGVQGVKVRAEVGEFGVFQVELLAELVQLGLIKYIIYGIFKELLCIYEYFVYFCVIREFRVFREGNKDIQISNDALQEVFSCQGVYPLVEIVHVLKKLCVQYLPIHQANILKFKILSKWSQQTSALSERYMIRKCSPQTQKCEIQTQGQLRMSHSEAMLPRKNTRTMYRRCLCYPMSSNFQHLKYYEAFEIIQQYQFGERKSRDQQNSLLFSGNEEDAMNHFMESLGLKKNYPSKIRDTLGTEEIKYYSAKYNPKFDPVRCNLYLMGMRPGWKQSQLPLLIDPLISLRIKWYYSACAISSKISEENSEVSKDQEKQEGKYLKTAAFQRTFGKDTDLNLSELNQTEADHQQRIDSCEQESRILKLSDCNDGKAFSRFQHGGPKQEEVSLSFRSSNNRMPRWVPNSYKEYEQQNAAQSLRSSFAGTEAAEEENANVAEINPNSPLRQNTLMGVRIFELVQKILLTII